MRPTDLRGILRYVPQFREKTFVIAVDGAIVGDDNFGNILMDVAVLWSLNIRTVLVHGASAQIQALAEEQVAEPSDLEGSGVTDAATLQLALTAANRLTHEILEGLSAADLRGAATNAVIAHPLGILRGVDHLFTGRVERIDVELLQTLLENGIVPVVPPLGMDGDGRTYRVNSDAVAVEIAKALGAVKLVYITTADGLEVDGGARPPALRGRAPGGAAARARWRTEAGVEGAARGGGVPRRGSAGARHQRQGGRGPPGRGLLQRGHRHPRLRERLPPDPAGPQAGRAQPPAAHPGLRGERGAPAALPGRHREAARRLLLFEVDRNPVACVALHVYAEEGKGELACLCVRPSHENQGLGRRMVQFVEERAREKGLETSWSRCPPRPSTSSCRRRGSPTALPLTCRPRAASATNRAGVGPRCS